MSQATSRPTPQQVEPREGPLAGLDPESYGCVTDRLREVAAVHPDRPALVSDGVRLTYGELVARVDELAGDLAALLAGAPQRHGTGTGDGQLPAVGLLAEQSADTVAAQFAVMATGHPCVVLDLMLPASRLEQIVGMADIAVVLTDATHRPTAEALAGVTTVRGLLPDGDTTRRAPAGVPRDAVATIVFTSGSTGVPKGVPYTHSTVLASGWVNRVALRLSPGDRAAMVLPQAFAAGQVVAFAALLNGATLHVRDPRVHGSADLVRWVQASGPTILPLTPSLLRALLTALPEDAVLRSVRVLATVGEKVFGRDVARARRHLPTEALFVNWMGSSETDTIATHPIPATQDPPSGAAPAGAAAPLREVSVLGPDGSPVATGEVGVLHVTSAYLASGYWRNEEETAARFERQPDGRTRYRTGDHARIDDDGVLHVLGRADDAVKIRGYLVEPGEVESALRGLPDVLDAVVRPTGPDGARRLVAWVVPDPQLPTPSEAGVRTALGQRLPDWMVPRDVVLMTALPRTERGKVDRAALPEPPDRPAYVPPATTTEEQLEEIWARLLQVDRVGRDESLTALGGDSLVVEEMLAAVHARTGVQLYSAHLAERPTLAEFAATVDAARRGRATRRGGTLVTLRATGSRPPLFLFAGAGGAAWRFSSLAAALGAEQPVHAFQVNGLENRGIPDWTVTQAARRYVRVIDQLAPEGPVSLGGHSLGGLHALKVADLLRQRGREVLLVTVLDTFLPPAAQLDPDDSRARVWQAQRTAQQGPVSAPLTRRQLWQTRLRVLGAGILRFEGAAREEVFHQQGVRVARFHRPVPWPGRGLVVLSNENGDDVRGWQRLFPGDLEIERVDADHLGMLKPPWVERVAEAVRSRTYGDVRQP